MFHGGGSPRYATTTPQCASILPPRPQTGQHGHFVCESPVCVCVSAPLHMLVRTIFPCTGHHDTIRAVTGFGRIGRVGRELVVGDSGGCKPENASVYLGNKTAGKIERATGPCHTSDDDQGLGGAQGKERERERARRATCCLAPQLWPVAVDVARAAAALAWGRRRCFCCLPRTGGERVEEDIVLGQHMFSLARRYTLCLQPSLFRFGSEPGLATLESNPLGGFDSSP